MLTELIFSIAIRFTTAALPIEIIEMAKAYVHGATNLKLGVHFIMYAKLIKTMVKQHTKVLIGAAMIPTRGITVKP